jgi:hypothetical protein
MLWGRLWTGPMGRVVGRRREGEVGDVAVVVECVGRALVVGGGMLS